MCKFLKNYKIKCKSCIQWVNIDVNFVKQMGVKND